MKTAIYYDNSGCIVATETWQFDEPPEPKYDCAVLLYTGNESISSERHYVDGNVVHRIPIERPPVDYPVRFNPSAMRWVDVRSEKEASADDKRHLKEQLARQLRTFDWNEQRFQVDDTSLLRIKEKLALLDTDATVAWRTTGNQFYTFDAAEFAQFFKAAREYADKKRATYWQAVDALP